MVKQDACIIFCQIGAFGNTKKTPNDLNIQIPNNIYVYTEDTDLLYTNALQHGAKVIMKPHDSFWGDRFCSVLDIDGYEWSFGTKLSK